MHKLSFYITPDHLTQVKQAIFKAGAGSYDGFKNCCWQTQGEGQYQPDDDSLKHQPEYKVEVYCEDAVLEPVLMALKKAHPCDDPAYDIVKINR